MKGRGVTFIIIWAWAMVVMIFDYGHATLYFTMLVVWAVSLSVA